MDALALIELTEWLLDLLTKRELLDKEGNNQSSLGSVNLKKVFRFSRKSTNIYSVLPRESNGT